MRGRMIEMPLLISSLIEHAVTVSTLSRLRRRKDESTCIDLMRPVFVRQQLSGDVNLDHALILG